jgi:hypothetical protein
LYKWIETPLMIRIKGMQMARKEPYKQSIIHET